MLDLPLPLGPTTTLIPGPKSSWVRSGNDLNPFRVSDLRCTRSPSTRPGLALEGGLCGIQQLQRNAGGLLLGLLLRAAAARSERAAVHLRDGLEEPIVGRALLGDDPVAHDLSPPREPLLELALEVVEVRDRELDLGLERLRNRLRGGFE